MTDISSSSIIYQHPLAYLLGLEGFALMRAFAGEYDRTFTEARIAEVRELLDSADVFGPGVDVPPLPVADGYAGWAMTYDGEDNDCFPMRDIVLTPMLDRLRPGRALDAACGTGAVAQQLVARGHDVIGIDISDTMLARAREAVPQIGAERGGRCTGGRVFDKAADREWVTDMEHGGRLSPRQLVRGQVQTVHHPSRRAKSYEGSARRSRVPAARTRWRTPANAIWAGRPDRDGRPASRARPVLPRGQIQ